MDTRAIYVSLYICQWNVPERYENILTSCSCNLLCTLLICQYVKELIWSLPLWFRLACSVVGRVGELPVLFFGSLCWKKTHIGKAVDFLEVFKKSIGYYPIPPLRKWPALGVCHMAGHGRAATRIGCSPCMPQVKQHHQGWNRDWDGSSPPIAPLSHGVSPTDQVLQKQVVELLFYSFLHFHSLLPFQDCGYVYCES